jgi:putative protease
MKIVSYAQNFHQAQQLKDQGVSEVIIGSQQLSRFSTLSCEQTNELLKQCKSLGMKCVLDWDVLMTQNDFDTKTKALAGLDASLIDSIRVQDPGALNYILEQTSFNIQFLSISGNHNLEGLLAWRDIIGERLQRMVLSIEIPKQDLIHYQKELNCDVEFLVFGRILLFYTPRNLLSSMLPEDDDQRARPMLSALGESEESPHKGFPLIENSHGTFMFHIKNHCLLNDIKDIKNDITWNLDLRFDDDFEYFSQMIAVINDELEFNKFKEVYPRDFIKGFFNINKSDVLFKKLKNTRLQREDESYIGEVLEIRKSEYMIIKTYNNFEPEQGAKIQFVTPEGKKMIAPLIFLKDSSLKECKKIPKGNLMAMNYMSGVWVKSKAYIVN